MRFSLRLLFAQVPPKLTCSPTSDRVHPRRRVVSPLKSYLLNHFPQTTKAPPSFPFFLSLSQSWAASSHSETEHVTSQKRCTPHNKSLVPHPRLR